MSKKFIRKDYLAFGNDKLISCNEEEYNYQIYSIKLDCEKMCKMDCNEKYYQIEIETFEINNSDVKNLIKIRHNEFPDIYVEYIPEMNLIGFFCNFGGLLGMWLGWSFSGIFSDIFNLINKISFRNYFNLILFNINILTQALCKIVQRLLILQNQFVKRLLNKIM